MAGLFGLGGSAAKTDRKNQLGAWGDLEDITKSTVPAGEKQAGEGASTLKSAVDYFKSLLSNDPGKVSQAIAPQVRTLTGQEGQQLKTTNEFSNRSGGTNASLQKTQTDTRSEISNIINSLIPTAAHQVGALGTAQEGLGLQTLSIGSSAAAERGAQASGARPGDQALQQQQQSSILKGLLALVGI